MPHDPLVLAYLAGIIDADGYVSIQRSTHKGRVYYGPKLGIAGTRREPHDLAASLWGGAVSMYTPKNPDHRPQFQWGRHGAVAAVAIGEILPYLRIKAEHGDLALQLWDHLQNGRTDDPYPWFGPDYDPSELSQSLRDEIAALNIRGRRKSPGGDA